MAWKFGNRTTGKSASEGSVLADLKGQVAAIQKVMAVIEFDLNGRVLTANSNFLNALGYRLEEIQGQHHSMFVAPELRNSEEYRQFWQKLARGEYDSGQYMRLGKGGREVWIQASYNPILDAAGKPFKVVKYATDITSQVVMSQQMQRTVAQTKDVIHAAVEGDLSQRVDTSQATGGVASMGNSINELLGSVAGMLAEMQAVVQGATEGDLTRRVSASDKHGDLRRLAEAVNSVLASMAEMVVNVKAASGEVLRGAEEISQGNVNLSQRTEQQSSSLEETASSMEQMTSTVRQNADNAGQANQLATAARDQAEKGGSVVSQAVSAMGKINEASTRIADIIGVIDEIAFQTNLLALNAAVEAARAGEQGRGFAVVASEVRSLAGRSASAAKEIKELIQDSVRKVEDGSVLVTQSGQTLGQIVVSVKKVSDIIAEIAAASREQSSGIEQVNKAVMQMDEMTQQNAALVEQATAASQSMADQARQLARMMERYSAGEVPGGRSAGHASEPVTSAVAPSSAGSPVLERRSGSRPWTRAPRSRAASSAAAAPAASAAAPAARKSSSDNDSEWTEF
jgi:methyl-accepting chemotaxis protein